MQDFYDPSRIDSMQEMFKTTAEHPSVISLNGTKPIPGTFLSTEVLDRQSKWRIIENLKIFAQLKCEILDFY